MKEIQSLDTLTPIRAIAQRRRNPARQEQALHGLFECSTPNSAREWIEKSASFREEHQCGDDELSSPTRRKRRTNLPRRVKGYSSHGAMKCGDLEG